MTKEPTRSDKMKMSKTVEAYLNFIHSGDRMGARSKEWHLERIKALKGQLKEPGVTWSRKLQMTQSLRNHEAELTEGEENPTAAFVAVVLAYSDYKGIDYATWRELGVPARVLKEAGEW